MGGDQDRGRELAELNAAADTLNDWLAGFDVEDSDGPPSEVLDAVGVALRAGQAAALAAAPAELVFDTEAASQLWRNGYDSGYSAGRDDATPASPTREAVIEAVRKQDNGWRVDGAAIADRLGLTEEANRHDG